MRRTRAKKSSSDRTASSPTSEKTSPISSGSSACSGAISGTASSAPQASGHPLWATTSQQSDPAAPPFGHASRIYNVIDSRQMYLQALLSQALRALGHAREAEHSIHFSYEMVALSHATARELGYEAALRSDEAAKPFVEVSGRKGLGVKIDDLLDLLTRKPRQRWRSAIRSFLLPSAGARRRRSPSRRSATSCSNSRVESSSCSTSRRR